MRTFATFLLLGLIVTSCNKPESITPESLTGTWVEKTARKDTLIFNPTFQGEVLANTLTVNRGREINMGGYLMPKIGSGLYQYSIEEQQIHVLSMYSSSIQFSSYSISCTGDELHIGNFFELGFRQPATAVRTLVRL